MSNKPATKSQRSYLFALYSKGIGEYRARWYMEQLKLKELTVEEASKEIKRLQDIRLRHGPTAMKPLDWDRIQPDSATLDKFWEEFSGRVKVVKDKL